MDTALIITAAVVAAIGAATWAWTRSARPGTGRWAAPPRPGAVGREPGRVVLDLEVADPEAPAVQRLAVSLAHEAMAGDRELMSVVVTDVTGRELVTVRRPEPLKRITVPETVQELTPRASRAPSVVPRSTSGRSTVARPDQTPSVPVHRELDARFELPPTVLAEVHRPDDGTDLVRAILVAGGRTVVVEHGVIRTGDEALLVLGDAHGRGLTHDDLSDAFLRFQHSGARRGIAIVLGFVAPTETRRRQALAPELVYVGPDAIQRMADAVALGVDPLRFAIPSGIQH